MFHISNFFIKQVIASGVWLSWVIAINHNLYIVTIILIVMTYRDKQSTISMSKSFKSKFKKAKLQAQSELKKELTDEAFIKLMMRLKYLKYPPFNDLENYKLTKDEM
jgi:hypothetical protein